MTDLRKAAEEAAKVLANALSIDFNDKRDWYSYKHDVEYAANLLRQALAQPEPVAKFDDPKVQLVYEILCSDEAPPKGEHWEGFMARRIVDALAHPEQESKPMYVMGNYAGEGKVVSASFGLPKGAFEKNKNTT